MSSSDQELQKNASEIGESDAGEHVHIPDLPFWLRIALHILGWVVIFLGLAGLVLPGLQGILLILLGAAILSVASDKVHRWLENLLEHRPKMRGRLNAFRTKLRSKLHRHR